MSHPHKCQKPVIYYITGFWQQIIMSMWGVLLLAMAAAAVHGSALVAHWPFGAPAVAPEGAAHRLSGQPAGRDQLVVVGDADTAAGPVPGAGALHLAPPAHVQVR